jgi:16S rRNA (adenine1518-N6/adenine1519-N6)-dimethyltransferase
MQDSAFEKIYKPTELKLFLDSLGTKAKKSLSQNFLIDGNILKKILKVAEVHEGDLVLEIGAGPGALTQSMLEAKAKIIAVEKDRIFANALKRFTDVDVHEDDIMKFAIEKHIPKGSNAKVIANLPYHLTTPILSKVLPLHEHFQSVTVMVQDEVAKRFVAKPGCKDYSSISVFLNIYSEPIYAFKVGRNCFYPAPKVDSAIVVLKLKPPPQINIEKFFEMTRHAFQHRRKMLKASLRDLYNAFQVVDALNQINKDPLSRPENLSVDEFLQLFLILQNARS